MSPAAPTASQCETEWGKSEADDACQNENITVDGVMCRIEAECLETVTTSAATDDSSEPDDTYFPTSSTEAVVTLDEVADLYNCGGVLTIGSC